MESSRPCNLLKSMSSSLRPIVMKPAPPAAAVVSSPFAFLAVWKRLLGGLYEHNSGCSRSRHVLHGLVRSHLGLVSKEERVAGGDGLSKQHNKQLT